jgi:hypothetical protein
MLSIQHMGFVRTWLTPLAVGLGLATGGCVDKEKCDEAIRVTRDALSKDQPSIARQWRERAWKICNDPTMTAGIDKEIVDKEAEIAKKATDATKAVADAAQARMNTATTVWRGFDKLSDKDKTPVTLDAYHDKAERMSQGLPPEYVAQITTYNAGEYTKRKALLKPVAK